MNHSEKGRELHLQAENAREHEQDFVKSLQLITDATVQYAQDHDYYGMAEVQGSRFNAFKHLYQETSDKTYLLLAKYAAMSAVEIGLMHSLNDKLSIQYRDLGKAHLELEEYTFAREAFTKALENLDASPDIHNAADMKAEILSHLGEAEYKSGDNESGLKHMNESIEYFSGQSRHYAMDVWHTGALMRKAACVYKEDPAEGQKALEKAREIIESNEELTLRKKQLQELEKLLSN